MISPQPFTDSSLMEEFVCKVRRGFGITLQDFLIEEFNFSKVQLVIQDFSASIRISLVESKLAVQVVPFREVLGH